MTLTDNEIIDAVSIVQNPEKTRQNIAAFNSGFFSGFVNPLDKSILSDQVQKLKTAEQLHFVRTKTSAKLGREALSEAKKQLGLSKGAKVRQGTFAERFQNRNRCKIVTAGRLTELNQNSRRALADDPLLYVKPVKQQSGWVMNPESAGNRLEYLPTNNTSLYLMRRDWSKQTKLQVIYRPSPSDAPSANNGDRYTEKLTSRAVKKIFESGAYVAACHGGFTTFLTLTFDEAQRARILGADAEMTIGSEVSRFLDGAKKVFKRGFEYTAGSETNGQREIEAAQDVIKVAGNEGDFHYVWVAECPANDDGEPNPHVHMLLNWQVEPQHFNAWSKRLENIWGHGFGHLERIQYKEAASGYLIKAVGYAAKGNNANQGIIRGNRYNIARCSRAPDWEVLATFDVDNMTSIIKECGYKLEQWRKPIARELRRKQTKKEGAIRALAINNKPNTEHKLKRYVKKLEEEIRECREKMRARGVYANSQNSFALTFEGDDANNKTDAFLLWATGARGWSMTSNDLELSDIRDYAKSKHQDDLIRFQEKQADWRSLLASANDMNLKSDDEVELLRSIHWRDYEENNRLCA